MTHTKPQFLKSVKRASDKAPAAVSWAAALPPPRTAWHKAGDGEFGVVVPDVYAHVLDLVGVAAQPDLDAQRLGAFREFPVDGEQSLKVRFSAAGLDLNKLIALAAPNGAQANVVLFLLPQPRQPGGGLGLKYIYRMISQRPAFRGLKKLAISNSASSASTST